MDRDLAKLKEMPYHSLKEETVNWIHDSGGIVMRIHGEYFLWSVPLYGGKETFEGNFTSPEKLVELANTWT